MPGGSLLPPGTMPQDNTPVDEGIGRRHMLSLAVGGMLTLPASRTVGAQDEREAEEYEEGVSISSASSSADEFASAITADEFYDEVNFYGNPAQAEVFSTELQGYPTDGDTYGIISSGVAKNAPGASSDFESTYFSESVPSGEIPLSPNGDSSNDPAALELLFTVPKGAESLNFTYTFGSEEFPTYVGTTFQDFFMAEMTFPDGSTENIARLPNGEPVIVDNAADFVSTSSDVVYNKITEQIDVEFDVSDYQGQQLELTLAIADVGDSAYDSAVFLDELSLGDPLQQLISAKQATIDAIQSEATDAIGEEEANSRVDQRAQSLLDDINADTFDAEADQYRRALQRMNATESVTHGATTTVTGDDSPTNTIIRDLYSLITGAAIELLPEVLEGAVSRVAGSILDDVVTKIDDLAGSFSGRGVIPSSSLDDIDDSLNAFKHGQATTIEEYVESNPEDAKNIVEATSSGGLKAAKEGAEGVIDLLNEGRSIQDTFEELYFEEYYFSSEWPEVNIPVPDEIEIPDIKYSYDLPDEDLPRKYRILVPDEISVDIETADIDVPDAPGIENAVDILEQVTDLATPSGINGTIDDRMAFIEDNIESLAEQDDSSRGQITDHLNEGIEGLETLTQELIKELEDIQGDLTTLADLTALAMTLTVVGAGFAVLTGFGTLGLLGVAATLATVATYLGVAGLVVDYVQVATGQGYLTTTNYVHHLGTYQLAETDLGGMSQ